MRCKQSRIDPVNENLADTSVDQQHNMVFLAYDLIRINVSTDIGGSLWCALEDSNEYDFIYGQHVNQIIICKI
jgi:hypothetical protein